MFLGPAPARLAPGIDLQLARIYALQRIGDVPGNGRVHIAQLADFGRVAIDMDDAGPGSETVRPAGRPVVKPRTDTHQQITVLHRHVCRAGAVHAQHAEIVLRIGMGAAKAFQRGHGDDTGALHEIAQGVDRTAQSHTATDVENRFFRLGQQGRRCIDRGMGCRRRPGLLPRP